MMNVLKFDRQFFRDLWKLSKPYWTSEEKWSAIGLLIIAVACSILQVQLLVFFNKLNQDIFNALQAYDKAKMLVALEKYAIILAIVVVIAGYGNYFNGLLVVRWRRWLTGKYLNRWLQHQAHYRIQILSKNLDNPDQRISEDLSSFPELTLNISLGIFQAVLTIVSFSYVLWSLSASLPIIIKSVKIVIPGYLFWVAFLYAIIGTKLTTIIGKRLSRLQYQSQYFNADFRFGMVRLREASEQVAIYHGEKVEKEKLTNLFTRIFNNFLGIIQVQKHLTFFTTGYTALTYIFGIAIALPMFFAKKVMLGVVMQVANALRMMIDGLSVFINAFATIADWRAVIFRLTEFSNFIDAAKQTPYSQIAFQPNTTDKLQVHNLDIMLPDGSLLLHGIDVTVNAGDTVLITGPTGIGKSTFMRVLAGIWPYGTGEVKLPAEDKILFLSQKPYLPLGSLKDAILYPHTDDIKDAELIRVLTLCGLEKFIPQLHENRHWSHELSLGEQQLIAFARVFLSKPNWIFMDEATSALDEEREKSMYAKLRTHLPHAAIIGIGHRESVKQFHAKMFSLQEFISPSMLKNS